MATCQSETVKAAPQALEAANRHPEHHLPFVRRNEAEGGIDLWSVPPQTDYSEGWHEGEYRAIALLSAISGNRYSAPDVLKRVALDQVRAGLSTPGHKGAILGFWDIVLQLIIPCINSDNVGRMAVQLAKLRCRSLANSTRATIEMKAEYRRIALKAAATRKAKAGKAVQS